MWRGKWSRDEKGGIRAHGLRLRPAPTRGGEGRWLTDGNDTRGIAASAPQPERPSHTHTHTQLSTLLTRPRGRKWTSASASALPSIVPTFDLLAVIRSSFVPLRLKKKRKKPSSKMVLSAQNVSEMRWRRQKKTAKHPEHQRRNMSPCLFMGTVPFLRAYSITFTGLVLNERCFKQL